MKQEANMTRRPITRADEDEVRRRVALALGDNGRLTWGRDSLGDGRVTAITSYDWTPHGAAEKLAREGIFPGPDGWEIEDAPAVKVGDMLRSLLTGRTYRVATEPEAAPGRSLARRIEEVGGDGLHAWETDASLSDPEKFARVDAPVVAARRKLPAPWQWWPYVGQSEFLARSNAFANVVAVASCDLAEVFKGEEDMGEPTEIRASSLAEARERAEDECWKRGLFGVIDAPPVDREQAIREALLASLADGNRASMPALLSDAVTATGDESVTSRDVLAGLGAVGAVTACNTWRLSDGPPPGWEWHVGPLVASLRSSPVDGSRRVIAAVPNEEDKPSARAAALLACRRAGLFAPSEPTIAALSGARSLFRRVLDALGLDGDRCVVTWSGDSVTGSVVSVMEDGQPITDRQWEKISRAGIPTENDRGRGPSIAPPLPLSEPSADPAARMLLRMFSVATGIGIDGTREGHPDTTPMQRIQQVARLCDSFVTEIRAKPAGFGDAMATAARVANIPDLVDYLSEHHADTWHANESAAAFAVRLLRSADDTIETLRREAEGADAARAVVATERDTFREEARRLREQVGALDRECSAGAFNIDRVTKERDAAREERDRFERLHAAAEVTAGEIEVELGKVKTKLARAAEDMAAMRGAIDRTEQFLSGKVTT